MAMEVSGSAVYDFDAHASETVFWERLPVVLQLGDREETRKVLSFRLLLGASRELPAARYLRMYIFSEDDVHFLNSLEVGEEDFPQLKAEQGILVDFSSFADKLVVLLHKCLNSESHSVPHFCAYLRISDGQAALQLVETNDFKQLAHISLSFRPGTDSAVTSFLAFRMCEIRRDRDDLRKSLDEANENLICATRKLRSQQEELQQCKAMNAQLREDTDSCVRQVEYTTRQNRIREREEYLRGLER